ncbi:MAG: 6-bladed beta-propeller [Acidobacteria bacterium]|nr:6-bladed beta-propeller [Acidobacteriota bacterium]
MMAPRQLYLLLLLLAAGPGSFLAGDVKPPSPVWPPPPDTPRIAWQEAWDQATLFSVHDGFFDRIGRFLFGKKEVPFETPYALCLTGDRVGILDSGTATLWLVDRAGGDIRPAETGRAGPMASPVGLTADAAGRMYVTDSGRRRILIFDTAGEFTGFLGQTVAWERPVGIACDAAGDRFWVSDSQRHQIVCLDAAGRQTGVIGRRGNGPGQFNFPGQLALDGRGRLYVVDSLNFRIQVFSPGGDCLLAFGTAGDRPGSFARPRGIAVSRHGHVYVSDALSDVVQVFDDQGRLLMDFGRPGRGPGEFAMPAGLAVDGDDRIYVADHRNHRVQVFRFLGEQ